MRRRRDSGTHFAIFAVSAARPGRAMFREDPHATANPLQCIRDELRRPSVPRTVVPSARSILAVQGSRVLAGPRSRSRERDLRRPLPRRRDRLLRRVQGQQLPRHPAGGPDPGERPDPARRPDRAGDPASRHRHHRIDVVRAPLYVRTTAVDRRPPYQGPGRLEHRDLVSRERREERRRRRPAPPRQSLRRGSGIHGSDLQAARGELGGRRRGTRPEPPGLHHPGEGP